MSGLSLAAAGHAGGHRDKDWLLDLAKIDLRDDGAEELCQGKIIEFRKRSKAARPIYQEIDCSQNQIAWRGCKAVVDVGLLCADLRVVKLFKNLITDAAAPAICQLVGECKKLEQLHLSYNLLTERGVTEIVTAADRGRGRAADPERRDKLVTLWLRLEHNRIRGAPALLEEFWAKRIDFCEARDAQKCGPRVCKRCSVIHLPYFSKQDLDHSTSEPGRGTAAAAADRHATRDAAADPVPLDCATSLSAKLNSAAGDAPPPQKKRKAVATPASRGDEAGEPSSDQPSATPVAVSEVAAKDGEDGKKEEMSGAPVETGGAAEASAAEVAVVSEKESAPVDEGAEKQAAAVVGKTPSDTASATSDSAAAAPVKEVAAVEVPAPVAAAAAAAPAAAAPSKMGRGPIAAEPLDEEASATDEPPAAPSKPSTRGPIAAEPLDEEVKADQGKSKEKEKEKAKEKSKEKEKKPKKDKDKKRRSASAASGSEGQRKRKKQPKADEKEEPAPSPEPPRASPPLPAGLKAEVLAMMKPGVLRKKEPEKEGDRKRLEDAKATKDGVSAKDAQKDGKSAAAALAGLGNIAELQKKIKEERSRLKLFVIKAKQDWEERRAQQRASGVRGETNDQEYYTAEPDECMGPGKEYVCEKSIGKGVFSSVFQCRSTRENFQCAVKIVRSNDMMRRAADKELEMYRKLQKSGPREDAAGFNYIIKIIGVETFAHEGHLCMVFELLKCDLRAALQRYGQGRGLPLQTVAQYSRQIFLALRALRKLKVIHGDLKPDNILMSLSKTEVKICDFGSAMDVAEQVNTAYAQPRYYRAPEIMLGNTYDTQIDLWSAAVTLFELGTGKILFTGRSNNAMMRQFMDVCGAFSHRMVSSGTFAAKHFNKNGEFLHKDPDSITGEPEVMPMKRFAKPSKTILGMMEKTLREPPPNADRAVQERLMPLVADLVMKCTRLDPAERFTPEHALAHPFYKKDG